MEELGERPGIPDLKNAVPGAKTMPALQPQEAQCHQTLRLCIRERAGRAVSVAVVEPIEAAHNYQGGLKNACKRDAGSDAESVAEPGEADKDLHFCMSAKYLNLSLIHI